MICGDQEEKNDIFRILVRFSIPKFITKIEKQTKQRTEKKTPIQETFCTIANDNDNRLNGYLMIGFLIFIYVITIVCMVKWGDLPLMT